MTTDINELKRLLAADGDRCLSISNGDIPSISCIEGLPFPVSVVMWATDLTEADHHKRQTAMECLVALRNAAPALIEEVERLRKGMNSRNARLAADKIHELEADNAALRARLEEFEHGGF